ncbi:probable leucine-rich repeat receptor-like serine/threonine-protein kinase At3g14840 [Jatropha curcas]|uniref:probable leucine-rich repeat receptor-like serine/threonine-protein kinase At3g14840 n=1 Tax=Jatropha curcas TaxID=180498 RepID=UPI001893A7D5|nr:probable leucine-rich repeat receptor-like serine/threonine-protein kinase At3g14840 [Jatropha curcas]
MLFFRLLVASVTIFCFTSLVLEAAELPNDEVEGLREIGKTLGKKDWNINVDSCSNKSGWGKPESIQDNNITCDCGTICHVTFISLKSQNLQGMLPTDLSKLPYLKNIDLTRNYLNGTIPSTWGSTQLEVISLLGNRLTGPIPKELGNISTLIEFVVESNQLSGELPQELGNLNNIRRMLLSSNNFSGQLPETFASLTTLDDFRIGDNQFTGQIPSLIQNWTNITRLVIQASGLSGPIPTGISLLTKMIDLRISDLSNGTEISFPPLNDLKNLKILILRSCNIGGQLPPYLGQFTKLSSTLDLSFNKLTGPIPSSFSSLSKTDFIYFNWGMMPE